MRHLLATLAVALLMTGTAFAGALNEQNQAQGQIGINKSYNSNKAAAGAAAGAFNKGNNTSVTVQGDDIDPPAYAPNVNLTSSPCIGSAGGSGGGLGLFSVGFAMTTEVVNCFKIEVAKMKMAKDDVAGAEALLQSIDWYADAMKKADEAKTAALTTKLRNGEVIAWATPRVDVR